MPRKASHTSAAGKKEIEEKIAGLVDWRGGTLGRLRSLIKEADPAVTETIRWRKPSNPDGVLTWEHGGILCTGETYQEKVKLTFATGALLKDPKRLFNASLEGRTRRAIDLRAGDDIEAEAFKELIREAVAMNLASGND